MFSDLCYTTKEKKLMRSKHIDGVKSDLSRSHKTDLSFEYLLIFRVFQKIE